MEVDWGGIYLYEPPISSTSPQVASLIQSGSEQAGLSPFIFLSRDGINRGRTTAVGVPLSTNLSKANSYRIQIPVTEIIPEIGISYDFRNSVALCDHVRVIDLNQLRRKIGRLSYNAAIGVGDGLANVFDLR